MFLLGHWLSAIMLMITLYCFLLGWIRLSFVNLDYVVLVYEVYILKFVCY